ncbi:MAG TPA: hypothetical protein PK052_09015 [Anaerohalosphaeraceae bacterium]|nr:hypothetical protein [Anaerohalosphaeraceae bacterium]HOM77161.1 hypothetical protein [Anaerohalosphaeraceae bacterium]HPC65450.1 hypothetical protein [Anaerohalosphaeraceae bacterium]HPO70410.1 hypothetical protein [Anaerohalosphaeraceae bacterium]HRS71779.1 hypothetical protein [Anaerohalosphaeraceae bacterium]
MAKQTDEQKRRVELIDELLKDYKGPESCWGQSGPFARPLRVEGGKRRA